jgi:hypothetical protein
VSANSLVEQWRRARAKLTRVQYQAQHPYAFLVSAFDFQAKSGLHTAPLQLEFHTQIHATGSLRAPLPEAPEREETLILPLRKVASNPFPDRISVGRAPNCDVVIRAPSVSKLHGHFREVTANSAVLTDAKSSNGTRVDNAALAPGLATLVAEFSHVSFGRVRLQLLSASAVYDLLDSS